MGKKVDVEVRIKHNKIKRSEGENLEWLQEYARKHPIRKDTNADILKAIELHNKKEES